MIVKQLMTAEELWMMPEVPGKRFELVEGEIVEVSGAGAVHNLIVRLLARLLDEYLLRDDLGVVHTDGTGYVLRRHPDQVRIPDVSFVRWERVPETGVPTGFYPIPPDLAVEVVSPDDRAREVREKAKDYVAAGVNQVWILWPDEQSITVLSTDSAQELGPDNELDGGGLLPGFQVRVADLFQVRRQR
jgi:Uma2 family endonuclease